MTRDVKRGESMRERVRWVFFDSFYGFVRPGWVVAAILAYIVLMACIVGYVRARSWERCECAHAEAR